MPANIYVTPLQVFQKTGMKYNCAPSMPADIYVTTTSSPAEGLHCNIYCKPPSTWMQIYTGLTLDQACPEGYCENPRACVDWTEMVQSPTTFFRVEDLPQGILLGDPSHLFQEEVLTLRSSPSGTYEPPSKRMGMWASSSLDVTHKIKEKTWGRILPGRPRERGQTSRGIIAPPLMRLYH